MKSIVFSRYFHIILVYISNKVKWQCYFLLLHDLSIASYICVCVFYTTSLCCILSPFIYIYIYIIYKFVCRCNSTYIGMTCQRLEVRVRQHIPSSLLSGRLTSGHSQAMDSDIGEHLLTINSCRTSYEDDCFSVLQRARDKFHLKFLEAIYISINRPSLCRQLNNHTLNILGLLRFFLVGGGPSIWLSWLYIIYI